MQEYDLRAYLDPGSRQMEYYLLSEEEREELPLAAKFGLGALALTGALAIGHRTGLMSGLARFLDVGARGIYQAAREVWQENGRLFGPASKGLRTLTGEFIERSRANINRRRYELDTQSREYDMERLIRQKNILIKQEIPFRIQEGLRFQHILNELKKEIRDPRLVERIGRALEKGSPGFLRFGADDEIVRLLKEARIDDPQIVEKILEIRRKYRDKNFVAETEEGHLWVTRMQEAFHRKTIENMSSAVQKDSWFRQAVRGHRQATVGDILKLYDEGKIRLNAKTVAELRQILKESPEFKQAIFDRNLYLRVVDGQVKEIIDYKVFEEIKRSTMEWWSTTLPGGLLHLRDRLNILSARENAPFYIMSRGSVQPVLNAHLGRALNEPLHEDLVFMFGRFYRLFDDKVINDGAALEALNKKREMYLTSAQFGTTAKLVNRMAGITTDESVPRGRIREFFDLGRQDRDNYWSQVSSIFTKFRDPKWERRLIYDALQYDLDREDIYALEQYFRKYTRGFSPRVLNQLTEYLPVHIQQFIRKEQINFARQEDVIKIFEYLGEQGVTSRQFQSFYRQYKLDPYNTLNRRRPIGETNPFLEINQFMEAQTGYGRLHQELSLELIRQIMEIKPSFDRPADFRTLLQDLYRKGHFYPHERIQGEWLYNYYLFRRESTTLNDFPEETIQRLHQLFRGTHREAREFQESITEMVRKTNPVWQRYSSQGRSNVNHDQYLAMNVSNYRSLSDLWRQLSPFTGRNNMEDFTTLSVFTTYYPAYRIQDALANLGLGFSDKSLGSAAAIWSELALKRFLPIYLGVEYFDYLDYKIDEWTGAGIDERWENYKAKQMLEKAARREALGLVEEIKREQMLHPGIEHFAAMPSIHLPIIGEVGPGRILAFLLADGTPIHEYDSYTVEETIDYLKYGTEEIRKGRWWAFGSKTPYRGDRIITFLPNSYRMAFSDAEYSDVTLTAEERWSHHILPTLENPLGLLAFVFGLRDPYYWERKHYYDRPYLLTGALFNPTTPLFGDIGNATLGQLIKPIREMHPEYWGDPYMMTVQGQLLGQRPDEPKIISISPSGRIEAMVPVTPLDFGGEQIVPVSSEDMEEIERHNQEVLSSGQAARYIYVAQLDENRQPTGSYILKDLMTNDTIFVPASLAQENMPPAELFELAAPLSSPLAIPAPLYQEEYAYTQHVLQMQMMRLIDPRSMHWQLQEILENWTEPLGIYKWLIHDQFLGLDFYPGQQVIQRADIAYNASSRFWELELGSLGSQLSEQGRRFIRRYSSQIDWYNPVPNTMPDWLPGGDYFINFQIGDPYSKIPFGEYRLPGEAYEKLNPLHPDQFGRYGAFDRFKILADVAPWSDEYRFWEKYVTKNIQDPELRKQIAQIKKQVAKKKAEYEFYPYRFKDKELVFMDVTVKRFLDDYTFLTEEMPDQPIRLAGMRYQAKAEGVMQQYFNVGDVIRIGIDKDPTQRIADDMYGTMRAVVFTELGNINRDIIERGLMKENETDFSAPGVYARFSPEEIARGARWESIAHFESPLNTKFLAVRSALEEYERNQIYGTSWATWDNFLLSDYIIPGYQSIIRHDVPEAFLRGAIAGLILGKFLLGTNRRALASAMIGGLLTGIGSLYTKWYELRTGETWIPKRRRLEHDINEYFDILEYIKYRRLYEEQKRFAESFGFDVDALIESIERKREENRERKKQLEAERRWLYLNQPEGWEERKKEISRQIEELSERSWEYYILPEPVLKALYYYEQMTSTLYAIDPYEDVRKILAALPEKDRPFFTEFLEATEEDRERILELVPKNQRRIYKALWGMGEEEPPPLEYYFAKYNIPGPEWPGWRPEINLRDIQVKVVRHYGLDLHDFGFWQDDVERSSFVPNITPEGNDIYNEEGFKGYEALKRHMQNVLEGQGLYDVHITIQPIAGDTQIQIHYIEDRTREIEDHLRHELDSYV